MGRIKLDQELRRVAVSVTLAPDVVRMLDSICTIEELTRSTVIEDAIKHIAGHYEESTAHYEEYAE